MYKRNGGGGVNQGRGQLPLRPSALTNANPSYLLKTVLTKCEEEGVTGTTEAVLFGLENPASNQVLILTFQV